MIFYQGGPSDATLHFRQYLNRHRTSASSVTRQTFFQTKVIKRDQLNLGIQHFPLQRANPKVFAGGARPASGAREGSGPN